MTCSLITNRARLPVMVWIPGGGFFAGDSSRYDGLLLAGRGVVNVTFNYGVGVTALGSDLPALRNMPAGELVAKAHRGWT